MKNMGSPDIASDQSSHLLILHLSDIHFRVPYCLDPSTDVDHPVRKALTNDISRMVSRLGNVDVIMVSGDIAFSGKAREYEAATKWFSEVAKAANCPHSRIFMVPGNHDVVRATADERKTRGTRLVIKEKKLGPERDKELQDTLLDEHMGNHLLAPMTEYNIFSAPYGCDLTPERPFWIEELPLSHGWTLKIHGLTTTFFSGPEDDSKGNLYLGALQRVFSPEDGIVRLALFHHPPDWLIDCESFDDALWEHCSLHLFGHKHRQRYLPSAKSVRLAAGAVNPSRNESNWEPGYNLVKISIAENGGRYSLNTESFLRNWQANPDRFVGKIGDDDLEIFSHSVRLTCKPLQDSPAHKSEVKMERTNPGGKRRDSKENEEMENSKLLRDLVFHFWQLSPSQRRRTMQTLNLLEDSDNELPETQQYRRAFERARERQVIIDLKNVVTRCLHGTKGA